jgi:hypothetical protein
MKKGLNMKIRYIIPILVLIVFFSLNLISCKNQTNENIEERLNNLIIDITEMSDEITELQNES